MKRLSIVAIVLVFSFVNIITLAGTTDASTSRVAIISKLEGSVEVQKSGGKKTLKGFKNMSLNQGDVVSTGKDSMVVLKFSNGSSDDDTFVLESNTSVTFSKISNSNGTTTKVKMLKGKAWVDVKSIQNKDDNFELETPTAIMGVRGTNFLAGVDPRKKESLLIVLSGIVQINPTEGTKNSQNIYPASAIVMGDPNETTSTRNHNIAITNVNLEQFLSTTSAEVIEAFLESSSKIISENEQFIQNLKGEAFPNEINSFQITNEQYEQNVENLLLAIAKVANQLGTINYTKYTELVNQIKSDRLDQDQLNGSEVKLPIQFSNNQLTTEQLEAQQKGQQALLAADKKGYLADKQKQLNEQQEQKKKEQAEQAYIASLSDQERVQYEKDKLDRLNEGEGSTTPPNSSSPLPPSEPSPTDGWDSVQQPYTITHREEGMPDTPVATTFDGFDTYAYVPMPMNDTVMLLFASMESDITIDSVQVNGEAVNYNEDDNNYEFRLNFGPQQYEVVLELQHSLYGAKTFTVWVVTEMPIDHWETIVNPLTIIRQESGIDDSVISYGADGHYSNLYAHVIRPLYDPSYLLFSSNDSNIMISYIEVNGQPLEYNGMYNHFVKPIQSDTGNFTVNMVLMHAQYGPRPFTVEVLFGNP